MIFFYAYYFFHKNNSIFFPCKRVKTKSWMYIQQTCKEGDDLLLCICRRGDNSRNRGVRCRLVQSIRRGRRNAASTPSRYSERRCDSPTRRKSSPPNSNSWNTIIYPFRWVFAESIYAQMKKAVSAFRMAPIYLLIPLLYPTPNSSLLCSIQAISLKVTKIFQFQVNLYSAAAKILKFAYNNNQKTA